MRRARLQAAITGRAKAIGPTEAHERNVLAITKRIHTKSARLRALTKELKALRSELRFDRRELRAVLQRDASIGVDGDAYAAAGSPDAIDIAEHRRERNETKGGTR